MIFSIVCVCLHQLAQFFLGAHSALAQFEERATERGDESWYFSDYMQSKQKSKALDYQYRFFLSQRENRKPRVEPAIYGLAFSANAKEAFVEDGTPWQGAGTRQGYSYGGEVYFNNFVGALLQIPTLTIVPGIVGRRSEVTHSSGRTKGGERYRIAPETVWGPSVRLFGSNGQDSALFVDYILIKRNDLGIAMKEWRWQGRLRFYLSPVLALEAGGAPDHRAVRGVPDAHFWTKNFHLGGFLEWKAFRLGYVYERHFFELRTQTSDAQELADALPKKGEVTKQMITFGLAY